MLRFDVTSRQVRLGLSDHLFSPVRVKIECCKSLDLLTLTRNLSFKLYRSLPIANRWLYWRRSYPSGKVQLIYFTAPVDKAAHFYSKNHFQWSYAMFFSFGWQPVSEKDNWIQNFYLLDISTLTKVSRVNSNKRTNGETRVHRVAQSGFQPCSVNICDTDIKVYWPSPIPWTTCYRKDRFTA